MVFFSFVCFYLTKLTPNKGHKLIIFDKHKHKNKIGIFKSTEVKYKIFAIKKVLYFFLHK